MRPADCQIKRAMSDAKDMNGLWTGWYSYQAMEHHSVPVTVWFDEASGVLTGTMLEPNTFADPAIEELSAELAGMRAGSEVIFTKRYFSAPGVHDEPIRYQGVVDDAFEYIAGSWRFDDPRMLPGVFELRRSSKGVSEALRRKAEAPLENTD